MLAKARQLGHGPGRRGRGRRGGRPARSGWAPGSSSRSTSTCSTPRGCWTTPSWCTAAGSCWPTRRSSTRLRAEIDWVFVDEYQDTDPAQVRLLQAVAGDGRNVVVVGDPDQSIYAFRGAEARGILDFPDRFRTADGAPAPVLALATTRRFGPALLAASRNVARRLGVPRALPGRGVRGVPASRSPAPGLARGSVEVFTCSSPGAEAEHIAEILRSAHLRDGLAWDEMAVLVRAGRSMIPGLTRALTAAGVPVEVAGDEIPLAANPAVRPLLLALQVAARGCAVTPDEAQVLLTSPLGGMDSMAVRRLGRALREAERAELAGTALPRPSAELTSLALRHPDRLDECGGRGRGRRGPPAGRAARGAAHRGIQGGQHAPRRRCGCCGPAPTGRTGCGSEAARAGEAGRRANRDLDAICALFDIAARSEEMSGPRGLTGFLAEIESQQIPADPMRESDLRGVGGPAAHRPPGQGPGVGARGGGRGPGGRLARRTPPRVAAGGGPAGPPRR